MEKEEIRRQLVKLKNDSNKEFVAKLVPNIEKSTILGIKQPVIKDFVNNIYKQNNDDFLKDLPHLYLEENIVHISLIYKIKDYDLFIEKLNSFIPHMNCWMETDRPKTAVLKNNKDLLIFQIDKWLLTNDTYTLRYAIHCLMSYYLDEDFDYYHMEKVVNITSEEYYVNMMRAWYFATALAKQYEHTVKILEGKRLDVFTHNKTIQKAIESYRIDDNTKNYLKTLRIKRG